jgi:hypothetical protein
MLAARGAEAATLSSSSRVQQISYHRTIYKARNLVNRLLFLLKDWQSVENRYDKLSHNYLFATISYRCN